MTTTTSTTAVKPPRELFRLGADLLPVRTIAERPHILLATMGKGPFKGKRGSIGGHLERGDTFVTAVLREGEEEGGMRLDAADLIPLMVVDEPDRDVRDGVRGVGVAFMVDADRFDIEPVAGDDVSHVEWVPADELAEAIATGSEQFAYDHAKAFALACRIVANPDLWPPKPRSESDEAPLLLFPIAAAAVGRQA